MGLSGLASVPVQSPGCSGVPSCDPLCGEVLVGVRLGGARAPGMEGTWAGSTVPKGHASVTPHRCCLLDAFQV